MLIVACWSQRAARAARVDRQREYSLSWLRPAETSFMLGMFSVLGACAKSAALDNCNLKMSVDAAPLPRQSARITSQDTSHQTSKSAKIRYGFVFFRSGGKNSLMSGNPVKPATMESQPRAARTAKAETPRGENPMTTSSSASSEKARAHENNICFRFIHASRVATVVRSARLPGCHVSPANQPAACDGLRRHQGWVAVGVRALISCGPGGCTF